MNHDLLFAVAKFNRLRTAPLSAHAVHSEQKEEAADPSRQSTLTSNALYRHTLRTYRNRVQAQSNEAIKSMTGRQKRLSRNKTGNKYHRDSGVCFCRSWSGDAIKNKSGNEKQADKKPLKRISGNQHVPVNQEKISSACVS
ncbi:hypothetical protein Cpha266_0727 [Chlorobium phaeobacteroides DSM 266]|uniref:Uncharacterized protein n=1 Tax=Chlorobium phaeobacteroides (strain DSM 266 / SMG 266 / 2430) TaxID=290317 RepID=A1BEF4_CHLPD|nr:hypothetical protein Cpha266_0727 [Chlorobium phaeobacteroides DSM 266]